MEFPPEIFYNGDVDTLNDSSNDYWFEFFKMPGLYCYAKPEAKAQRVVLLSV